MSGPKKKNKPLSVKDAFKLLNYIFAAILVSACAEEIVFPASESMPTAEAILKIDELGSQDYDIDLNVYNIPEAQRLSSSGFGYVVWMVTRKDGTVNIGPLMVNSDNHGSLQYISSYEPIRIFITEEIKSGAVLPSSKIVLDSEEFDL